MSEEVAAEDETPTVAEFDPSAMNFDLPSPNERALKAMGETNEEKAPLLTPSENLGYSSNGFRVVNLHGRWTMSATGHECCDIEGNTFNPDTHSTDENGRPKLTRKGLLAKKRGRKNKKAETAPPATAPANPSILPGDTRPGNAPGAMNFGIGNTAEASAPAPAAAPSVIDNGPQAKLMARVIVTTLDGAAVGFVGKHAKMVTEEARAIEEAWTEYLNTVDLSDVPPWLGAAVATGAWAGRVAVMPETLDRLKRAPKEPAKPREPETQRAPSSPVPTPNMSATGTDAATAHGDAPKFGNASGGI